MIDRTRRDCATAHGVVNPVCNSVYQAAFPELSTNLGSVSFACMYDPTSFRFCPIIL